MLRRRPAHHHAKRSPQRPTDRSSRSSKATAPGRTSGALSVRVFDAAVEKAYGGKRKIAWKEVLAGREGVRQDRQLAAG